MPSPAPLAGAAVPSLPVSGADPLGTLQGALPGASNPADDPAAAPAADPAGAAGATPAPAGGDPVAGTTGSPEGCVDPTSAASLLGWGNPVRSVDFTSVEDTLSAAQGWTAYSGSGDGGRGTRTPDALNLLDGLLTISGDAGGTTGGLALGPGQLFGRWEVRARIPVGDPNYHAVLMLWPDSDSGAEIDFLELQDPDRGTAIAAVHNAEGAQDVAVTKIDATQWHNWAVEWTPTRVTAYVDGKRWFETTDPALVPSEPMHLCLQLDYFGDGDPVTPSSMEIDWVRQYPAGENAEGGRIAEGGPDQN
ncbi:Glycosyl hydrolases family 16 [Pseudonocardia thermophila]|uniref:Glycosyl hydrolases family 16 n=1 Tax=Pseudonocardia thermophila TaxID=1848 RepID=A0A1M6Z3G4_PSETH|nr:Glycosyl hydrolases family 16 [Pseudonocardia thermophila]